MVSLVMQIVRGVQLMKINFCLNKDEWLNFPEWDGISTRYVM